MVKDGENSHKLSQKDMQELLIENFVGLQKAMTNLSIKFETLSDQIRRLLEVFELSAKNFISGEPDSKSKEDILEKINSLLDQNKTIAKGLVLLEEQLSGPRPNESYKESIMDIRAKPLPKL